MNASAGSSKTDGTDTGWLLATTRDDAGQVSNEASDYVSP